MKVSVSQLPIVGGKFRNDYKLSEGTWLKVGGLADVLYIPDSVDSLCEFLRKKDKSIPYFVLGLGSNLLVRDGGFRGVAIRLGNEFSFYDYNEENKTIVVGASMSDVVLAGIAKNLGIKGFEFLAGIPGTIGGNLRMNAGAFGSEIKDILVSCQYVDIDGNLREVKVEDMGLGYRSCNIDKTAIFVSAKFNAVKGDTDLINSKINEIRSVRDLSQPKGQATAGSTFANPEGAKAWELIDKAGYRGFNIGGAYVSDKHCNFLINKGNATADDFETLGETIRKEVYKLFNIKLKWEIQILGEKDTNG